jgi:hypothetical protein
MWRLIYLAKMPLLGKRARIALDWLLDLVFGREIAALPINRSVPAAHHPSSAASRGGAG